MAKTWHGPGRRTILAVGLATVCVPAAVVGVGIGSFGAGTSPAPPPVPAVSVPAAPPSSAAPPFSAGTTLPWADEIPAPVATPAATTEAAPVAVAAPEPAAPEPAAPVHVRLDRLGISSDLMTLGMNADGTVEVPTSARNAPAGWYDGSVPPGEIGAAVILGHVDSIYGPGVFYHLRSTRVGDRIVVERADGRSVEYTVDRSGRTRGRSSPPTRCTAPSTTPACAWSPAAGLTSRRRAATSPTSSSSPPERTDALSCLSDRTSGRCPRLPCRSPPCRSGNVP